VSSIGTLDWTRSGGGRLTARERAAFMTQGVAMAARAVPDKAAYALGLRKDRLARLDLDAIEPPDTAAARAAEELADGFPKSVWHHSHRSYLWALALGKLDGEKPDEELLYVASLMHDAGLVGVGEREPDACFTLASAGAATGCAERGGWEEERRARLAESITLHINPIVTADQGVEASLLARGSTLDAVAIRSAWRVDPATKRAVLQRHPRANLKQELVPALRTHAKEAPKCRIATLWRYGGLSLLVKRAPWDG
jgi:hypothetical protein